jgi:hypothetical protein
MTGADYRKQGIAPNETTGTKADRQTRNGLTAESHVIASSTDIDATGAISRPDAPIGDRWPTTCKPRRKRRNLLQLAAPTAYTNIIKE